MNYQQLTTLLRKTYDAGEAQAIARLLADKLCGISFADLLCGAEIDISDDVVQRIERGEPIQYIIGSERFFGREFEVGDGVLIPRPETEELCQWIIEDYSHLKQTSAQTDKHSSILDIGTGSGAIAITLAAELTAAKVSAIDISEKALAFAKRNAERNEVSVDFIRQDILKHSNELENQPQSTDCPTESTAEEQTAFKRSCWDIIVSNPPYIMKKERAEMSPHVLNHEPSLALFVPDNDPLLFYRTIADYAMQHLSQGGTLYFEINPLCANEMTEMLSNRGFKNIELRRDQFGKERMIKARRE